MINDSKLKELRAKIGGTHLTELTELDELKSLDCHIYAKVESSNPTGSIKDRIVLEIIEKAYNDGLIKEDTVLIDSTNGNMGISLAYIGYELGIETVEVMPDTIGLVYRNNIKKYGGKLITVNGNMKECMDKVEELCKQNPNYYCVCQYKNHSAQDANYKYTGREIFDELPEIDCFVAPIGSGATISGCGRYLKEVSKSIQVIGIEAVDSSKNEDKIALHVARSDNFDAPRPNLDKSVIDNIINIDPFKTVLMSRRIYKKEGISCGLTSGSALLGAIKYAKKNKGKNIVVIFPDSGDRYSWN